MEQLLFTIPNRVGGLSTHSVGWNGVALFRPTEWVDCRPTLLGMEQLLFRSTEWVPTVHPLC